jgi:hypothetical protein
LPRTFRASSLKAQPAIQVNAEQASVAQDGGRICCLALSGCRSYSLRTSIHCRCPLAVSANTSTRGQRTRSFRQDAGKKTHHIRSGPDPSMPSGRPNHSRVLLISYIPLGSGAAAAQDCCAGSAYAKAGAAGPAGSHCCARRAWLPLAATAVPDVCGRTGYTYELHDCLRETLRRPRPGSKWCHDLWEMAVSSICLTLRRPCTPP